MIRIETYTVKKGDTLYGISNQYGVSVTELARLNNVDANTLQIGQVLRIPSTSGTNPNNMFMYTVVKGDTLYNIAKKYNTTVPKILDINHLTDTTLQVGQIIRIPETYTKEEDMYLPQYINYIVKKGDTLYKIAKEYNLTEDIIKKDNALITDSLTIGQNLKIRTTSKEVEECFGEDYQEEINNNTYIVKRGDTLYNIAKSNNTTTSSLIELNNLKSTSLKIGQELKIPNSSQIIYIVEKGDNLYDIARKYNTTVDVIKKKNNLNSNLLSIGQKLII